MILTFADTMIQIGKIRSLHGVNGEVVLEHQLPDNFDIDELDTIMIELLPQSFIPFFIEEMNVISKTEIILKLEEYDDRNKAIEILNKKVYAPPGLEIDMSSENEWAGLIGCELHDQDHHLVGTIHDILMNGKQLLLDVHSPKKDYLIPFSDELVIDFNPTQKILQLHIAEGLLDL